MTTKQFLITIMQIGKICSSVWNSFIRSDGAIYEFNYSYSISIAKGYPCHLFSSNLGNYPRKVPHWWRISSHFWYYIQLWLIGTYFWSSAFKTVSNDNTISQIISFCHGCNSMASLHEHATLSPVPMSEESIGQKWSIIVEFNVFVVSLYIISVEWPAKRDPS